MFSFFKRKKKTPLIIKYYAISRDLYPNLNDNFAYEGASCFDILSASNDKIVIPKMGSVLVPTGLKFCIPENYELQIRPKSGISKKMVPVILGTIDYDYRGEVFVNLYNLSQEDYVINYGDKIAQGHIAEMAFSLKRGDKFVYADYSTFGETERGSKGFGSSGV